MALTELTFAPPAPPMLVSEMMAVQSFLIIELPVGWQGEWHCSPKVQWVICLQGEMGYQVGDGNTFVLRPGNCILTKDTQGQGHRSWNAGTETIRLALIQQ